jgi:aminoglycoside phosphotransferase (APT) family kinase protein
VSWRSSPPYSAVPVPDSLWLEEDPAVLDRPFYATRRIEGSVPVPWAARDWAVFRSEEARRRLGHQFVEILSQVHRIDLDAAGLSFLGRPASADAEAAAAIAEWERMYERSAFEEVLVMREAFRWLRANLATSGHVTLVHGDFRIGNFMEGRIAFGALLDRLEHLRLDEVASDLSHRPSFAHHGYRSIVIRFGDGRN